MAGRWWPAFSCIWILSPLKKIKRQSCRVGPPLTKLSGSSHALVIWYSSRMLNFTGFATIRWFGHVERSSGADSEQHVIYRLMAGPKLTWKKLMKNDCLGWWRMTAVSGSLRQLTLKKGTPGDQVWDLLCVQLASYLEAGPLMWIMPLHLNVKQKIRLYLLCVQLASYLEGGPLMWMMPLHLKVKQKIWL